MDSRYKPAPWRMSLVALLVLATTACGGDPAPVAAESPAAPARYAFSVVNTFPHDPGAFTQGLLFRDGFLYESTGCGGGQYMAGRCSGAPSSLRKVELETGKVLQRADVAAEHFAEGLVDWQDRLIQLTWLSNRGVVYDLVSFKPLREFEYPGEGWGLAHDGTRLIMSDGTDTLRWLDPDTLAETGRLRVTERGYPVNRLNELEMVNGELFANIWMTDDVVVIAPATGEVTARIDFSGLRSRLDASGPIDVLNGIAFAPEGNRLFVTGKLWPRLFEVSIRRN